MDADALLRALKKIAALDPHTDSDEGWNEWGEADCFKQAQRVADLAIADGDTSDQLYYLQDSRTTVGNDMLWWAKGGVGYTSDLRAAHRFTKDEADARHRARETDIPWRVGYVRKFSRPTVDFQSVTPEEQR